VHNFVNFLDLSTDKEYTLYPAIKQMEAAKFMVLEKSEKDTVIKKYKLHEKDTGSAPVQAALLTERINTLNEHFKQHGKDHHSRRGLIRMINQRRKLLAYLKNRDKEKYLELIDKLNLRK
jgi:small subunit ribosomal protein S15